MSLTEIGQGVLNQMYLSQAREELQLLELLAETYRRKGNVGQGLADVLTRTASRLKTIIVEKESINVRYDY